MASVPPLGAAQDGYQRSQRQRGEGTETLQNVVDRQTVTAGRRVVIAAQEQQPIDDRAEATPRGVNQRQSQRLHRKLYAEQILRDRSSRSQDEDTGAVIVLIVARIEQIGEAYRTSQPGNRLRIPREVVPLCNCGAGVGSNILALRCCRVGRLLAGVDAEEHHVEFPARPQLTLTQGIRNARSNERAQVGTPIVARDQQGRPSLQQASQLHRPPVRFAESQPQRDPVAYVLLERDSLRAIWGRRQCAGTRRSCRLDGADEHHARKEPRPDDHGWSSFARCGGVSARAPCAYRLIARSIGMRANRCDESVLSHCDSSARFCDRRASRSPPGLGCNRGGGGIGAALDTSAVCWGVIQCSIALWIDQASTTTRAATIANSPTIRRTSIPEGACPG